MGAGIAFDPVELKRRVEELAPWHYCHAFPFGITTGTCEREEPIHPKLAQLLAHGAFQKPGYRHVLDLGANSGIIAMWFCDHKSSQVAAIENGERFYPQLELAIAAKGYTGQIEPIERDIRDGDFGKECFDLVLFLGTLHHIGPEYHRPIMKSCFESLVPGGEIVVQTKTGLPVRNLLRAVGFENVKKLYSNAEENRSAWQANKPRNGDTAMLQLADRMEISQLSEVEFRLYVLEAVGYLTLLAHWLRGRFNWQRHCDAVKFATEAGKENDDRLNHIGDELEKFVWEIAPPRALLPVLRHLRLNSASELHASVDELLKAEAMGRFPDDGSVSRAKANAALGWAFENVPLPDSFQDVQRRLNAYGVEKADD